LICSLAIRADDITKEGTITTQVPATLQVLSGDGMNLALTDKIDEHYYVLKITNLIHNLFCGQICHIPLDGDVTFGISLDGLDSSEMGGNKANVAKWSGKPGLIPVYTYADPQRYESYEWFVKGDDGRWLSDDPLKEITARDAGAEIVPKQDVVPREVAEHFLYTVGGKTYWSAFGEVDSTETVTALNIFRIRHHFLLPSATLAMHYPFSYTFQQGFISRLRAAKLPGVFIDKLGGTQERRRLQVIRLEDTTSKIPASQRQTVLLTAREHSSESASSWSGFGALTALLADTPKAKRLRQDTTWLIILMEDPDGSANSTFDHLTDKFLRPNDRDLPPEVLAYARYFTAYVADGRTIDITLSIHGVEATEASNAFCPFREERFDTSIVDFNRKFFADLKSKGYTVDDPEAKWGTGTIPGRLYGWCAARFGSFDLCFEVNDRYPTHRLALPELQAIGGSLATQIANWLASDEGQHKHTALLHLGEEYRRARSAYFAQAGTHITGRTPYELLILGY